MKATIVQFETQGPPDVMKFKDIDLAPEKGLHSILPSQY